MRPMSVALILSLLSGAGLAVADTTWVAAGGVFGEWSSDHSPYVIQGQIFVPVSDTLTIGPGVKVFFTGGAGLRVDSDGVLNAEGAENDSVIFTTDTLAYPEGWTGIGILGWPDSCRLSYCVVENARSFRDGGGLQIEDAAVTIENSTIRYNQCTYEGGGLLARGSRYLVLRNCVIEGNRASNSGGSSLRYNTGLVENCIFRRNHAQSSGGAMESWGQMEFSYRDCLIEENEAGDRGGGIWFEFDQSRFENCVIQDNMCHGSGGGVAITLESDPHFLGCTISGNVADSVGGGIWYNGGVGYAILFDKCVVSGNSAWKGGGIYVGSAPPPTIQRCTVVSNSATGHGGGVCFAFGASARLQATIVAFSTAGEGIYNPPRGPGQIRNCAINANSGGPFNGNPTFDFGTISAVNANLDSCDFNQNIYLNPLFVDSASDYHLTANSPCINAGPIHPSLPRDPDSTVADIGAFYFDQTTDAGDVRFVPRPSSLILSSFPNPFNSTALIRYELPARLLVKLRVCDLLGRAVADLVDGTQSAGPHTARRDAWDVSSGVYFCVLTAGDRTVTGKLVFLK
jgi:hypothetical protein